MDYPKLKSPAQQKVTITKFAGIDRTCDAPDGTFFHMENMTCDHYPALAPSRGRQAVTAGEDIAGLLAKDCLCYIDAGDFVMNGYRAAMDLTPGEKKLVSMGAYVVIFPDKKYINTLDLTDFGSLEAAFESQSPVEFTLCSESGGGLDCAAGQTAPQDPQNGAYWLDTSAQTAVLRQYSALSDVWTEITDTYIKIACPGIGKGFSQYDGVEISGATEETLNGNKVLWDVGQDYLVVAGILPAPVTQESICVKRSVPEMDYVIQCGNRLWGCRYGMDKNGQVVNEIYASKLGDFKNFNCYMGLSTDSYTASMGTDGPFTGAVAHLGYPLFFKENYLHKVYGNMPSSYQVQTTACAGVGKNCGKSLVTVEDKLYYCNHHGIWVYDGSLPQKVSRKLGNFTCQRAVAGAYRGKYYLCADGELWVYDTYRKLWHREDAFDARDFATTNDGFFALADNKIWDMGQGKDPVNWSAQTGKIGLSQPERSYISRLTARLCLEPGSRASFLVRYDSQGPWEHLATLRGSHCRSFQLPLRTRRCDHMELKIQGAGPMKLYSLTKTLEKGSDTP